MAIASKLWNSIRNGAVNERAAREQADAARMLVAQGADRDAIVAALMRFSQRANLNRQRSQTMQNVIRALMEAPRGALIEAETGN